jgi:cold shock CspA family protein
MAKLKRGIVKWFSDSKRLGFILPEDENARDVFVHLRQLRRCGLETLAEGQVVQYEAAADPEGRSDYAIRIALVDSDA